MPQDFVTKLYREEGSVLADKIISGMGNPRAVTLRANTLKTDILSLMKIFDREGLKYQRILWYADALSLQAREKDLEKLPGYAQGLFYLQSLSSMIPPLALQPEPGEQILDMTAAPGSKTTQIAAQMKNQGKILANELSPIRTEKLKYNLGIQGVENTTVLTGPAEKLGKLYPETFHRILLDAPCSGEGRFMYGEPATTRHWNLKEVSDLARLQKKLIKSAFDALKPGGILVYATCTLNREENEETVNWALQNFSLKIEKVPLSLPAQSLMPCAISGGIKILPTREMEGFFVCRLKKTAF